MTLDPGAGAKPDFREADGQAFRQQLQAALGDIYAFKRELGGGGMSRVFVAEETSLGRHVVVKFVAPELAHGLSVERFKREIALAARLQHPHIVPVLSAGDVAGTPYYTMPFVEGESLRARVADGSLPLGEAISLLRDVARALEYAHAKGVVHRDIKPDNILLAGNAAMVTDFGIAKAIDAARTTREAASQPALTHLGEALGTPLYMAPEQIAADPAADHRVDIYAFGCLAYELLAGSPPFAGLAPTSLFAAHLVERPHPIDQRRPDIAPSLAALVMRCLEKDPAHRPQSAAALLADLDVAAVDTASPRAVAPAIGAADERPFIAVLPFENLSPDPQDAYFADGLTDEVISDLAAISALRVIARSSVMSYKGSAKAPADAARELGVRHVVVGSVRRAGDAVRITARLVDTATDTTLWSDKLGGAVADVFTLQEQLSRTIVDALRVTLTAGESQRLAATLKGDARTFEGYLRARTLLWQGRPESLQAGARIVDETIVLTGPSAPLLALQGMFLVHISLFAGVDTLDDAEHLARRAEDLDPTSPDVYALRSAIEYRRGHLTMALEHARHALQLSPNHAEALFRVALVSGMIGDNTLCRDSSAGIARLDPLNPVSVCMPGWAAMLIGNIEPAIAEFERARQMDPANPGLASLLGLAYATAGRTAEAIDALGYAEQAARGTVIGYSAATLRAGLLGDREALTRALPSEGEALLRAHEWNPLYVAFAFAHVHDGDAAAEWLDCALRRGFANPAFLELHSPLHDPLRAIPRFDVLLATARSRRNAPLHPA